MKEILYFSAAWCGPCKQLSPVMERLKSEGKINYKKINVDTDTLLSPKYGVRNIPTLILLNNGNEVNRLVGAQPEQSILNFYNG
jgi:thioredoxin 1